MSNLGKPRPHNAKQIRERREKVLILMSKGMNQSDIAKELHTTRRTVLRDLKELNQWTKKGLFTLAKQSMATTLFTSITGQDEIEKGVWNIINEKDEKKVNTWHRLHAYRLLKDVHESNSLSDKVVKIVSNFKKWYSVPTFSLFQWLLAFDIFN
jgi:transcriptional antiterminator